MPIRQNSIDNDSVNDQLNKIDYSQDNEGMSASFYRHHDQWLAMQGTMKTNEYGNNGGAQTPSQPPLQSMGTMHSHRSSRSSNRRLVNRTDVRASSQNRPTAADTGELMKVRFSLFKRAVSSPIIQLAVNLGLFERAVDDSKNTDIVGSLANIFAS